MKKLFADLHARQSGLPSEALAELGVIHTLPLFFIVAAVGIISYLLISSTAPFKGGLFGNLNPKPPSHAATTTYVYPLKVSGNQRYLVDQNNVPFLMQGDSPHSIIGNLTLTQSAQYFADRKNYGFNIASVYILCGSYPHCNSDLSTVDGLAPFTTAGDLSTPNNNFFNKVDQVIQQAASNGITVILNPIETGGLMNMLIGNGTTKDFNYGAYLGNRYKNFPNIIWSVGNDYSDWSKDTYVTAVLKGIESADTNHITTALLTLGDTLDDANFTPIVTIDSAYSYDPTYNNILKGYNRNVMPVFLMEGCYEDEGVCGTFGSAHVLRMQEYWTMLSGGMGQDYGSSYWDLHSGWQTGIDSPGASQYKIATSFFSLRKWYDLIPDQNHTVVTSGFGTLSGGAVGGSDYLTAARSSDGTLVIGFMPAARTITVNMSKLAGAATANWFDPENGTYSPITGSPFANSGSRQFIPPNITHSDGTNDWVLVLETNPPPLPTATPAPTMAPSPTPGSNNFTAEFWNSGTGSSPVMPSTTANLVRNDPSINFNWGSGSPDPSINADHFIARWNGNFNFNAGTYTFTTTDDDGVRVFVDNQIIIDHWIDEAPTTYAASQVLTTGTHTIRMEYYENGQGAVAQLSWSQISGPTPTPTSVQTPTATPTSSPSTCPKGSLGDTDCNGKIDIFDFNTLVTNFGKTGTGLQGDLDGNGKVDIFDFNTLVTNFGH